MPTSSLKPDGKADAAGAAGDGQGQGRGEDALADALIPLVALPGSNDVPCPGVPPAAPAVPPSPAPNPSPGSTPVDGRGMWRSWTRVFARPESACLDLLDNCLDAALRPGFAGRVEVDRRGIGVVTIANNSSAPVKPLGSVLTVYRSAKNSSCHRGDAADDEGDRAEGAVGVAGKDSIGENGVGLKQGCAALSDCTAVLSRNGATVEVGIIARGLQSSTGVCLPSSSFSGVSDGAGAANAVRGWLASNPRMAGALEDALGSNRGGMLPSLAEELFLPPWDADDHVFVLVLCGLRSAPGGDTGGGEATPHHVLVPGSPSAPSPAREFLRNVRVVLPKSYINFPSEGGGDGGSLDFSVDGERLAFHHWQGRLVELTKFRAYVSADVALEDLPEDGWDAPSPDKHGINIYCGFDAVRVDRDLASGKTSPCSVHFYSRRAGRLVASEHDARHLLGLSTSGVDYTQGLTVIVDDAGGELPLTPTKDGIAWSERANGEVHRSNLLAWAGAVTKTYWQHHMNRFVGACRGNSPKEVMKKVIRSFAEEDGEVEDELESEGMADGDFTEVEGLEWIRTKPKNEDKWRIQRKPKKNPCRTVLGPSTLLLITADRIQRVRKGRRPKPKAPSTRRGAMVSPRPEEVTSGDVLRSDAKAKERRTSRRRGRNDTDVEEQDREVAQGDMNRVTIGALSFFREQDENKYFEEPVVESYPEIRDEYLQMTERPMDFRTIEKERARTYASISELREDLTLVFRNCLVFSGESSPEGRAARGMLDRLDDAIRATDVRHVAREVLGYLRDMDEDSVFEVPVVEQCPEIREDYLDQIAEPMDFSTIEEERVGSYTSIADLRDDLELVFENCIEFNGTDSAFGMVAQKMLENLDQAFDYVTLGKKRRRMKKINYGMIRSLANDDDEEDSPKPRKEKKKKIPYTSLEKKLRDREKRIQQLEEMLAARDERILELEEEKDEGKPNRSHGRGQKRKPREREQKRKPQGRKKSR